MYQRCFISLWLIGLLVLNTVAQVSNKYPVQKFVKVEPTKIKVDFLKSSSESSSIFDCEDNLDQTQLQPAEQGKIKAAITNQITTYLKQFDGTIFGSVVSIGDPAIFAAKIKEKMNLIYIGANGRCLLGKYSPKAQSYHYSWKVIGRSADMVFPFVPTSSTTNTQQQTLMHEMTHHIEWLNGVKQGSTEWIVFENPASERNTNYQDFVVNALIQWKKTEDLIKDKRESLPSAIHSWKILEETLTDLEKGTAAGGTPHDKEFASNGWFQCQI